MLRIIRKWSTRIALVLVGVALAASTVKISPAADRDNDCRQRIHVAEEKLRKAVSKHGERSPEAERWRRELDRVHKNCGETH